MNIPPYDDMDLVHDFVHNHPGTLDAVQVADLCTMLSIAFGDGYCRGYNSTNQWYTQMDGDIEYIKSFDNNVDGSGYSVDTFNDDLVGSPYGDVPNIETLLLYSEMMSEEQRISIDKLTNNVKVDLNKPLDDKDE
jgi:hypothetical protein